MEIDGDHHDSWMNLGWAFVKCEKPKLAVHCLEKALALKPDDSETAIQLGLVLARSGEPAAAALLLEQAAQHRPEDEVLKMWWAAALALSGKESQAQETYQQILAKGGKLCRLAQQQLDRLKNSVPANCA